MRFIKLKVGQVIKKCFFSVDAPCSNSEAGYRTAVLVAAIVVMPLTLVASGNSQTPFTTFEAPSGNLDTDVTIHHFKMSCGNCHELLSAALPDGSEGNGNFGKVTGNINKLCTQSGCHNLEASLNHPVGIAPKDKVPADMPLDSRSRITCLTCHNEQNFSSGLSAGSSSNKNMLRRPAGIQLCAACHTEGSRTLLEQSHWLFSTRAHLDSINPQFPSNENYVQFVGRIDTESRTCLSCHEDISVSVPSDNETPRQKRMRWKRMSNHPIGMSYGNVALRRPGHYQYPIFDQRIRLFNGRVGCGSCHSLYAQTEKNLVMRYGRGGLCLACHNK